MAAGCLCLTSTPGGFGLVRRDSRRLLGTLRAHDERLGVVGDDLQIGESNMIQHGETTRAVEEPKDSRIEKLLIASRHCTMGKEARPRDSFHCGLLVNHSLKEKISRTYAANALERVLGMLQMI